MAKTRTTTATHDGVTFTRSTARTYTHVVIGRRDIEAAVRRDRITSEEMVRRDWAWYGEIAAGTYKHMEYVNEQQIARATKLIALGLEAATKLVADESEQRARQLFAGWEALGWAGRPDLAVKEQRTWQAPIHCYAEVLIVPVQA